MGAGATHPLTKEEEVMLYEKLQETYDKNRGDKKILNEEEEHEMYQILQKSYKKMVIDLKRDQYFGISSAAGKDEGKDNENMALPAIFLKIAEPKGARLVQQATAKLLGLGSSAKHNEFCVGDVIRGKPEGDVMWYEGVIQAMNPEKTVFEVDFDGEIETVKVENAQRVLAWNTLELGDIVQAQPADERNYYNAIVIGINSNGTYKVIYEGDDEIEDNIPLERIRKICSNRSAAIRNWKKAFNTLQASKAFTSLAFGRKFSSIADPNSRRQSSTSTPNSAREFFAQESKDK